MLPLPCSHADYRALGCVGTLWTRGAARGPFWGVYVSSMTNHPEFAWDREGSRDVGFSNLNLGPSGQTGELAYPAPGVSVLSSHFTGQGWGGGADSLQTAPASCPQIPELSFAGCLSHHGLGTSPHCLLVSFYHLFLPCPHTPSKPPFKHALWASFCSRVFLLNACFVIRNLCFRLYCVVSQNND